MQYFYSQSLKTRQRSLIHNQMKGSYPFSLLCQRNNRWDRILNKHNIRTIFKSPKKIGKILRNPKDQRPPLISAGIYKIPCSCGQVYIGKTRRIINLRIKEYLRNIRLKHVMQSAYQTISKQDIKYCLIK